MVGVIPFMVIMVMDTHIMAMAMDIPIMVMDIITIIHIITIPIIMMFHIIGEEEIQTISNPATEVELSLQREAIPTVVPKPRAALIGIVFGQIPLPDPTTPERSDLILTK